MLRKMKIEAYRRKLSRHLEAMRERGRRPAIEALVLDRGDLEALMSQGIRPKHALRVLQLSHVLRRPLAEVVRLLVTSGAASLPNWQIENLLVPDVVPARVVRVSEEIVEITTKEGLTFFGYRSDGRHYRYHQILSRFIHEGITDDAYMLAVDIQKRFFNVKAHFESKDTGEAGWIAEGEVVVDAGCYTGLKAMAWSQLNRNPHARIYAVEMGEKNFEILARNLDANGLAGRIVPVHAGLWHTDGEGVQYHNFTTRRFLAEVDEWKPHMKVAETTPLLTLDSLIEKHGIARVDYLNIQTNGAELEVLAGLERHADRITTLRVAAYYSREGRRNEEGVVRMLRERGFRLERRSPAGGLLFRRIEAPDGDGGRSGRV